MVGKLIRAAAIILSSGALIVLAGGGVSFLRRPVGAAYLALWAVWWLANVLGRPRGRRSAHDRHQRVVVWSGGTVFALFVVGGPWEYAHWDGPLPRDGPLAGIGLAVFAGGIILQVAAMRALGGQYTQRLGIQAAHRLVTSGPYRWVRHPGYLGNLLSLTGISLALSSLMALGLTALTVPLIAWRIGREEAMLLEAFGDDYRAYRGRTRRLVPFIY